MTALGLARTYDALGDFDRALEWLEFEPRHIFVPWAMKVMSDSIKARPRFQAIVRSMDLESVIPPPPAAVNR